jgi:hydroxyacylglutathione hydrolase
MSLIIHQFGFASDNLGVLLHDPATGATATIDAGEAAAIDAALVEKGWRLTDILITHHHSDHIAGLEPLKAKYGARVVAPQADRHRIPAIDVAVSEGDTVVCCGTTFTIIATPGHTSGHIAYYSAKDTVLFAGDTLFSLGCGRLFEGSPQEMWQSLQKLAALPDETLLYCGHDYTLANGRFALRHDPDNAALIARMSEVERLRASGKFAVPVLLGLEKRTNPFLRASEPALAASVGLSDQSALAVFTALREAKNKA